MLRETDLADGAGGHRATPGGGTETLHGLRGLGILPRPAATNLGQRARPSQLPAGHDRGATGLLEEAMRWLCNRLRLDSPQPRQRRDSPARRAMGRKSSVAPPPEVDTGEDHVPHALCEADAAAFAGRQLGPPSCLPSPLVAPVTRLVGCSLMLFSVFSIASTSRHTLAADGCASRIVFRAARLSSTPRWTARRTSGARRSAAAPRSASASTWMIVAAPSGVNRKR
jgi:hypothetical protein